MIPNRFQASWDEEVVTVCASVVIEREKRESRGGDKMVGRFCNILRRLANLNSFDGARIEKGCARGRMKAFATLWRKEERREDDKLRYIMKESQKQTLSETWNLEEIVPNALATYVIGMANQISREYTYLIKHSST